MEEKNATLAHATRVAPTNGVSPAVHLYHSSGILSATCFKQLLDIPKILLSYQQSVRSAYQPPASSTFFSEQTNHQQSASSTFLSQQISTSHQPPTTSHQPNKQAADFFF
jgi:hypothetical protein